MTNFQVSVQLMELFQRTIFRKLFIALAEDGTLYRIDLAGNILPLNTGYTAKSGTITILNLIKIKIRSIINPTGLLYMI